MSKPPYVLVCAFVTLMTLSTCFDGRDTASHSGACHAAPVLKTRNSLARTLVPVRARTKLRTSHRMAILASSGFLKNCDQSCELQQRWLDCGWLQHHRSDSPSTCPSYSSITSSYSFFIRAYIRGASLGNRLSQQAGTWTDLGLGNGMGLAVRQKPLSGTFLDV